MLQTEHVEERLALSYVLALENRDLLKELTKPDQWVISEDLKVRYTTLSSHSPHWQPNIMISEKHFGLHESIFTVTNSQRIQRECLGSCLSKCCCLCFPPITDAITEGDALPQRQWPSGRE